MKTKNNSTKLTLTRKTIANLNSTQMGMANGGIDKVTFFNCPTGPMYTPCCP